MSNKYLTNEQISEFDKVIDESDIIQSYLKNNPIGRNVCRCGIWLGEELACLDCPEPLISSISCAAGYNSFVPVKNLLLDYNIQMTDEETMLDELSDKLTNSQYEKLLEDIWIVYYKALEDYKNNKLDFDLELDSININ